MFYACFVATPCVVESTQAHGTDGTLVKAAEPAKIWSLWTCAPELKKTGGTTPVAV